MFGVGCVPGRDRDDPESYRVAYFAQQGCRTTPGYLYLPIDNLTSASDVGDNDYTFWSRGRLIFAPPYLAGVIALALQVDPTLSETEVFELLRKTGHSFEGGVLVNPKSLVDAIRGRPDAKKGNEG